MPIGVTRSALSPSVPNHMNGGMSDLACLAKLMRELASLDAQRGPKPQAARGHAISGAL
jgi:hypothetical protein